MGPFFGFIQFKLASFSNNVLAMFDEFIKNHFESQCLGSSLNESYDINREGLLQGRVFVKTV